MKQIIILVLFIIASSQTALAQDSKATASAEAGGTLTLAQALALAWENNPDLLSASKKIEAVTGRAVTVRLWQNPELELSAEDVPTSGGLSQAKEMIGISQTVPFPGKKSLDAKIGRADVVAAEWEFRGRALELMREVKTAFYQLLAAERKVQISQQLVELTEALAAAIRKRVEAGAATVQEQLRAEVENERVKTDLSVARIALVEARQSLATLLGQPNQKDAPLSGRLDESADIAWLKKTREQLLQDHPHLKRATAARDRAELESRRAKLDALPDLKIGIAGGRDRAADVSLMEFRVSIPLPFFDRSQGKLREARANEEIARYDVTATRQRLLKEFGEAEAKFRAAAEQVIAYRDRILPKVDEALKQVQTGFDSGKFGINDLFDTQRTAAESRLLYQQKLFELNAARAALEALVQNDFLDKPKKNNERGP